MDVPQNIYYNYQDSMKWESLQNYIESNAVVEVSLDMYELSNADKEDIIDYLKNAEFYKSNWKQEGPTGNILYITFKNGKVLYLSYWGGGIFEISDNDGQFLIENSDLESLIDEFERSTN